MSHDLIRDRYGRLYELPAQLAEIGHEVLGICLSYRAPAARAPAVVDEVEGRLRWVSFGAGPLLVGGLPGYLSRMVAMVRAFAPDVVLGCSDAPHVVLSAWLARKLGVPYWADLYDNFESFGLTKIPGLTRLYRRALRGAAGVSTVSEPLAEHVRALAPDVDVMALESTIDPGVFFPRDRHLCRSALGLPGDGHLVGAAGALDRTRGIGDLYGAFRRLQQSRPGVKLILAGNLDSGCMPPDHPDVVYLGRLPHERMPEFYCALDVAVICMRDSDFGRYAFPQKAYEIMGCGTPIVATAVGALARTLASHPGSLYSAGDEDDLALRLQGQLEHPVVPDLDIPSWRDQAEKLSRVWSRLAP